MKRHKKYLATLIGLLALAPIQGHAADIVVDAAGNCTLADAIIAANTNQAKGWCGPGDDDAIATDIITLETDVVLDDPQLDEDARPPIISSIIIEGQGHTIDGNGGVGYVLKVSTGPPDPVTCLGGELTLNNATITGGNHAHSGDVSTGMLNNGGGITNACAGNLTLNNVTVSENIALGNGGGIFNAPWASLTLNNSTVSGNRAEGIGGGGVYNNNGYVTLNNSTISNNIATGNGGGICSEWRFGPIFTGSYVALNGSLLSGNTASFGNEIYESVFPIYADNFNLFGDSGETNGEAFDGFTPGGNDITVTSDGEKPTALSDILYSLADNGGLTMTHALVAGSPAIDLDADCNATGLVVDQRGQSRPEGAGCDAGSFELAVAPIDAVVATLEETALVVTSLDPAVFDNQNKQKTLSKQIDNTIELVDEELYTEAASKLQHSILGKTDGCVESDGDGPDKNDWINDCPSQEEVYDRVQDAIAILQEEL